MVRGLHRWITTGKRIPLAWQHSTRAEDLIGHIEPGSAFQSGDEVVVSGWIDRATEVGKHAWRMVKSGTLGFSYGYLPLAAAPRRPGGRHFTELDVLRSPRRRCRSTAVRACWDKESARNHADEFGRSDELRDRAEAIEREFLPGVGAG
jgi:hypothetical protein